ncbi:unannotated protein [freshwater metagenome]|uniref:Unannotated protein n=1 Tax=freshwater metagenome TaxID=449393 RepID=A0A6J7IL90_9ZZZZ
MSVPVNCERDMVGGMTGCVQDANTADIGFNFVVILDLLCVEGNIHAIGHHV